MGKEEEKFSLDDFDDIDSLVEFDELDDIDEIEIYDYNDLEDIDDIDDLEEVPSSHKEKELEDNDNVSVESTEEIIKEDTEEILAKEDIEEKNEEKNEDEEDDEDEESGNGKIWIIAAIVIIMIVIILLLLSSCNKKYTVTFESNGGTNVMEQEIEKNGLAVEPDKPFRTGYIFLGWYHGDKKFDFNTEITSDITLEAKWINGNNAEVRGVSLDQTDVTIAPDDTILLVATIEPEDALDQNVEWTSSNEDVATVDSNGNVTALSVGTTKILVTTTSGGYTAMCTVTVSSDVVNVKGITLDKTILNLETKDKVTLKATIEPEDATNKGIIWKSDNESVAKVNSGGTVEAVGAGSATITATTKDGEISATVKVNVKNVSVKNIALNVDKLTMEEKETADLKVVFDPENTTDTSVVWTSSDPKIVKVDTKGRITAVKPGSAIITVTTADGSKKATCNVTVKGLLNLIVNVKNNKDSYYVGDKIELSVSPQPMDAPLSKLTWTSDNTDIASVNKDGLVTTKGVGDVTITVTAENGVKASRTFKILEKVSATDIKINESNVKLFANGKKQLTTTVTPNNAYVNELVWTSSDDSIVRVDYNGNVTGKKIGTATITVSLKNNPSISHSIDVNVVKTEITISKIDDNTGEEILSSSTQYSLPLNSSVKLKITTNNPNAKLKYYVSSNVLAVTGISENTTFASGQILTITNKGINSVDNFVVSSVDDDAYTQVYFKSN